MCCHHTKAELLSRFGTRPVCVAGAVVAASGLLAASFSSSLAWLLATYSCVTGVGFGQYRMVTVCRLFRIVTINVQHLAFVLRVLQSPNTVQCGLM